MFFYKPIKSASLERQVLIRFASVIEGGLRIQALIGWGRTQSTQETPIVFCAQHHPLCGNCSPLSLAIGF